MATKTQISTCILTKSQVQNSVKTFELSKQYAKRLLKIGSLNILHQRIDIPNEEFIKKTFENVPYVIFKRKSQNKFIKTYHVLVSGLTDAIDKGYLKELFLYLRENDSGTLLETYNFKIKYNKEEIKSNVKVETVKKATIDFLQAVSNIPGEKLDSNKTELFVEFIYNNDVPNEYHPPYFEKTDDPLCLALKERVVNLCSVNTGFHRINCWGRGKIFNESRASTPAPTSHEEMEAEDIEDNISELTGHSAPRRSRTGSTVVDLTECISIDDNISLLSNEKYISCPCIWELDKQFETVKCSKCFGEVHLACHGYFNVKDLDETTFKCSHCENHTDDEYLKLLMKLRITLYGMHVRKELPVDILQLASIEERKFILNRLDMLNVYKSDAASVKEINFEGLNEAISQIFTLKNSQYFE